MNRVDVEPALLKWARERSGRDDEYLLSRFPKLESWERREARPTLRQVEAFAKATRTPVGYLFLSQPPADHLPVTDFRRMGSAKFVRPSPDLLDTIYLCQQRQDWYRNEIRMSGDAPMNFIGSLDTTDDVGSSAARLRNALQFDVEQRRQLTNWSIGLRQFIEKAEELGILVMVSGVVGSNTSRRLDPDEFRGFALSDQMAPLVFINGADTKAAQMFTLAHEIAHLWLGQSGVSNSQPATTPDQTVERWCNEVAAELLVPSASIRSEFVPSAELRAEVNRLAQVFKVSTLVILRRIHDIEGLGQEDFWSAYWQEVERLRSLQRSSGGNAIRNVGSRVSKRLARALVISTLEGRTSYSESFRLLGIKKLSTFERVAESLGQAV